MLCIIQVNNMYTIITCIIAAMFVYLCVCICVYDIHTHINVYYVCNIHTTRASTYTGICLVGKGIVYDSGGLSIKTPTAGMCGMKMVR